MNVFDFGYQRMKKENKIEMSINEKKENYKKDDQTTKKYEMYKNTDLNEETGTKRKEYKRV